MKEESLWKVVPAGGFVLSFIAGSVNVCSLGGIFAVPSSHVTGTISRVSMALFSESNGELLPLFFLVIFFFLGSVFTGTIITSERLTLGRRYGILMMIEGSILLSAIPMLNNKIIAGDFFLAFACGLQNSLATTFSGAILRSTHMTGIVTDLGILFGHLLRGRPVDLWRIVLYLALLGGFFCGGLISYNLYQSVQNFSLVLPAGIAVVCGFAYFIWRIRYHMRQKGN